MRILWNKLLTAALCVLLVVLCVVPALAESVSDYAILNVYYRPGQQPESGVEYRLYLLASIEGDVCTVTEPFQSLELDLSEAGLEQLFTTTDYQDLLQKADACIRENGVAPDRTGVTDAEGVAAFTQLQDGIWYVTTEHTTRMENTVYTPSPFALRIPFVTTENACLVENNLISAFVKFSTEQIPTPTPSPSPTPSPKPTPTPVPVGPNLPQTGQLWWPVPILLGLGLALVLLGAIRRKKS